MQKPCEYTNLQVSTKLLIYLRSGPILRSKLTPYYTCLTVLHLHISPAAVPCRRPEKDSDSESDDSDFFVVTAVLRVAHCSLRITLAHCDTAGTAPAHCRDARARRARGRGQPQGAGGNLGVPWPVLAAQPIFF